MIIPQLPMLAETATDEHIHMLLTTGRKHKQARLCIERVPFLYASRKLDGIRGLKGDQFYSRKLKPLRRKLLQEELAGMPVGCDGEFIVGDPTDRFVFQLSTSGVMSVVPNSPEWPGVADMPLTFHMFDNWQMDTLTYTERLRWISRVAARWRGRNQVQVQLVEQTPIYSLEELLAYEEDKLNEGYEGVILRTPGSRYKHGRSTLIENVLLRVKRFEDAEAEIIEVLEEMENTNEATISETGNTKRSTAKAGKVPKGVAGAFRCIDRKHGWTFSCGGFTKAQSEEFWRIRDTLPGRMVKYKFFRPGSKVNPRFPGFKEFRGIRHPDDM